MTYFFNYFITLLDIAPDLIVKTDKPKLIYNHIIALDIRVYGTKVDYRNKYLDIHIEHYTDRMETSTKNLISDTSSNKRTYGEFQNQNKKVCFNIHFTVQFVLNSDFTYVAKIVKSLKTVKLSVPRESFF